MVKVKQTSKDQGILKYAKLHNEYQKNHYPVKPKSALLGYRKPCSTSEQHPYYGSGCLRADLHGTTLSHATTAYDRPTT